MSKTPLTLPLAGVLRTLEGGVDTLALGIIKTVPTCKAAAQKDLDDLDATLGDAVGKLSSVFPGLGQLGPRGVNDPKGPVHRPPPGITNGHIDVASEPEEPASTRSPAGFNTSATGSGPHGGRTSNTAAEGARLASDGSTGGLLGGLLPKGNRVAVVDEEHLV